MAAVALTLSAGISPVAADHLPVDSDPDTTGPELTSFSITPTFVDVRTSSANITATAHITDDKSGVEQVLVQYRSPSLTDSIFIFFGPGNRISGSSHVGDYSTIIPIDTNRESGTWRVSSASTRDVVGNTRGYDAAAAFALGAVNFEVLSTRDATPPQLSAVRVTPSPLDVSSANGFATFEWDATDEGGSGVRSVNITLSSPSTRQLMQGQGFTSITGLDEVTLRGDAITRTFTPTTGFSELGLSQYSEPGTWTVHFVQVTDHARNTTTYQGADLAAIMSDPFFQVISNPTDAVQPSITAFRFSPSSIDVSSAPATVTVEFDVLDDLSGVQAAWLTFQSPTIAASPPFLSRTATFYAPMTSPRILAGTVTGSVTFPRFDRGGDWTVTALCVVDRVKNQRCYTAAERMLLGPTEITVISNRLTLTPETDENPIGTQHTVTATLSNQTGPLSGRTILFSVTGANTGSGSGTTDGNGQATFTYTGTNLGSDTITACHDGNTNATCEVAELKATAAKTWVPGGPGAPATLTLDPLTATNRAGEEHCVTATVKDASGNPTPDVSVVFSVSGANSADGSVTTDASGQAVFCYTGTAAGLDTIDALADTDGSGTQNGTEPAGSATKTYVAADPATLTLTPLTATNRAGEEHCVTATVKDASGNPTPDVSVVFSVSGANSADGSVTTDASGQAVFCYTGTAAGLDTIDALADTDGSGTQNGTEPAGSATKTYVAADPATLTLDPLTATNRAGEEHCVTATVKDASGNPTPDVSVVFSVSGANSADGSVTTDASGQAVFCYTGTAAGLDTIDALADTDGSGTQNGTEPAGSATKTYVAADPATLTLDPLTATNRAGEEHCVTATVKDASGNPTPDVSVVFSVSGANSADGSVTTDASGQAVFCYTGTAAGLDTIDALADTDGSGTQNGTEPAGSATKTYVAAAPATLTLAPPTATNVVGTQHCVTATVKDAFGNPVSGVTVRFSVSGSRTVTGSRTTDAGGQATICYTGPELPGADAIEAYADTDNDSTQDAGEPAGAASKTWILPASTPLCQVSITNGGRITANNGDKATFGGNAQVSKGGQPKGNEEYQDHGPAVRLNVKSTKILAVVCSADRKEATIYGQATINGSGSYIFKIDVRDVAEPGVGKDTYRILLSNGYDSGVHTLQAGNIQIRIG